MKQLTGASVEDSMQICRPDLLGSGSDRLEIECCKWVEVGGVDGCDWRWDVSSKRRSIIAAEIVIIKSRYNNSDK